MDRMIFDIFDLSGNNLISEEELSQMLLTLPEQAIISNLNNDLVLGTLQQNTSSSSSAQGIKSNGENRNHPEN